MSTLLEPVREFARRGRLTGTLQSGHQNDGRRLRSEFDARRVFAEDLDQFVAQDLDDLLSGREGGHNFLTDGLGLDVVDQFLDDLEVDVRLKQRHADFAQGFVDVLLGDLGLAAEGLEGALEFFL